MKYAYLLAATISLGIPSGWAQLTAGPMVGHTTDTSATIWAHAGQGKTVELWYGLAGAAAGDLIRVPMPPRVDRSFSSLAILPGLKPLTPYRFEIHVGGVKAADGTFTTAPPAGRPARFSYLIASCMDYTQGAYQVAWNHAHSQKGVFNLFVGDNVYANSTNHETLWQFHREQRKVPGYAALIRSAPTYATWDDHDFGPNDSHGGTPGKENSLRAFQDLWANPAYGTPQIPGVFYSYHWADVHFIVLDGRYHRIDEAAPVTPAKTQFGGPQLEWLYQQLKSSRAPFKVVVSGYDIASGKYPEEIRKIAKFIADNKIYGVLFHSGDIHRNDFRRTNLGMGYPVTQIVSSGITRVINRPWVMMDVNTTLADPTISARFFTQEKLDSTVVVKLSSLTPPGVVPVRASGRMDPVDIRAESIRSFDARGKLVAESQPPEILFRGP